MKTYRPGATLWPLLAWTLITAVAAFFVERYALGLPRGTEKRWLFQLLFAACLVLGPLAFAAHLLRRLLVSVAVDGARGLVFNGERVIPWSRVEAIEHRAAPFKGGRSLDLAALSGADGCVWIGAAGEGCAVGLAIGLALLVLCVVAYTVLLPVFSLLSPWHARVVIRLKDGGRIVLRDLEDDEDFVASARAQIRS